MSQSLKRPGTKYELRQIDAWADGDDSWNYNQTFTLGYFVARGKDHARAFRRALLKRGIIHYPGTMRVTFDGDIYETIMKKDGMPTFCAIPVEEVGA